MICTDVKRYSHADGRRHVVASMQTPTEPASMPVTGEGIEGLSSIDVIAPSSTVMVLSTSEVHVLGDDGKWYKM